MVREGMCRQQHASQPFAVTALAPDLGTLRHGGFAITQP